MRRQRRKMNRKNLRRRRVRAKISGTEKMPRFSVHTTLNHIYAQIIDDERGITLCEANDLNMKDKKTKTEKAEKVGQDIAEKAKKANLKKVVFDRGAKLYHGRIKKAADAARKVGLEF